MKPATRLAAVVAALVAGSVVVVVAQQPPTFGRRVDSVRVDVLVTDKGAPMTGLTSADFEVTDNGVAQEVTSVMLDRQHVHCRPTICGSRA